MATETPYQKRKRLEREKARRDRMAQQPEWAKKRAASEMRQQAEARHGNPQKTAGFGYGAMAGVTKKSGGASTSQAASTPGRNLPVGTVGKPKAKPPVASTSTGNAGGRKSGKPSAPTRTVSQSRTMWVKAGTTLPDGTVVKKGYVAQLGKPSKRVSANVKIETATTSGKKAGETYSYSKGKTVGKVKKK